MANPATEHLLGAGSKEGAGSGLAWQDIEYDVRAKKRKGDRFAPRDRVSVPAGAGVVGTVYEDGYLVLPDPVANENAIPAQGRHFTEAEVRERQGREGWRQILKGVTGSIRPGRLCAIMGPSGAGKSSLLNILAGRVADGGSKRVDGLVTLDGEPIDPVKFRSRVAYVMQEDALFATQTPREALDFSATLRTGLEPGARAQKVAGMLDDLRLTKCQHTYIGNKMIPGISGGEKKRTAIGCELISDPDILFLDEPTSGLDSYAAHMAIDLLRRLARGDGGAGGRTVVCTIHQPSSEVFNLFDDVFLISAGRVVYSGPRTELAPHFARCGYPVPEQTNPADHVMFTMQTERSDAPGGGDGGEAPRGLLADVWAEMRAAGEGSALCRRNSSSVRHARLQGARTRAGLCTQFVCLGVREARNVLRDKPALGARFGSTIFLNLIVGFVFYGIGGKWDPLPAPANATDPAGPPAARLAVANHFGAVAQFAIGGMFGLSQPLLLSFPLERPVFLREYATGTYGALPYFVSKLLVEVPLTIVQAAVMFFCGYWLIDMQGSFVYLTLATSLLGLVAASTALIIGAASSDPQVAIQLSPLIFVPQILFSGFFIRTASIPEALRWVQYVCSLKYGTNLIAIAEFRDPPAEGHDDVYGPGGLFESNDIYTDREWIYVAIMLGVFALFRFVALATLAHKGANLAS